MPLLPLALLLALPYASASDPRWGPPAGVRDGPDGTVQVRLPFGSVLIDSYSRDGAWVSAAPSWVEATDRSPEVDAAGGGNTAVWQDGTLQVTGSAPCTLAAPSRSGVVRVAVSATHAVVADVDGALLVDLARCLPVAALDGPGWALPQALGLTAWGLTAVQSGDTLLRWWDLPGLRPAGAIETADTTVLPGRGGPRIVSERRVVAPGGPSRPGRAVYRSGRTVVVVDDAGQIRPLDDEGAPGELLPAALLADRVVVDFEGPGFTIRRRPELSYWRDGVEETPPPAPAWLDLDRRVPPPQRDWPTPPLRASTYDPCVVRRQGQGLVVTCGAVQRGVFVDSKAGVARTDAAGRVLLTHERAQGIVGIFARAVADGRLLWKTWEEVVTDFVVGPDWVAAETRDHGWRFFDPATGADLGEVHDTTSLIRARRRFPLDPGTLVGGAWDVPTPEDTPWSPGGDAAAFALALPEIGCAGAETLLAWQAPWPDLVAHGRRVLDALCPAPPLPAPWPDRATTAGDGWVWRAPEPVRRIDALDGGSLLVETPTTVGVLGPDGALRWSRPHEEASAGGDVVVLTSGWTLSARDVATGELRWARIGKLTPRDGGWWLLPAPGEDPFPVDLSTGARDPHVVEVRRAVGWRCEAGDCAPDVPAAPKAPAGDHRGSARSGGRTWRVDGDTVTAWGTGPGIEGGAPLRATPWARAPSAGPALGPLPAWPVAPPGPSFDGGARFVRLLDPDGGERWREKDRFPVGIVGDVAVVLVRGGARCEGRDVEDGHTLWEVDLVGELPEVAGALFYTRGKGVTRLRDVRTGAVIRTWTRDLVLAGPPDHVVYADRTLRATVQDSDGRTLATIEDSVPRVVVEGGVVGVLGVHEILAFRDGRRLWAHPAHDYAEVRIVDGLVLLRGHRWRFAFDLDSGALVAAGKEPPAGEQAPVLQQPARRPGQPAGRHPR